jgi:hypothetical protein
VAATVELEGAPRGLAAAGPDIWVTTRQTGSFSGSLVRVSEESNAVVASFSVTAPETVAAGVDRVWVIQSSIFTISEFDAISGALLSQVRAGCTDGTLVLEETALWVSDLCGDRVLQVAVGR